MTHGQYQHREMNHEAYKIDQIKNVGENSIFNIGENGYSSFDSKSPILYPSFNIFVIHHSNLNPRKEVR